MIFEMLPMIRKPTIIFSERFIEEQKDSRLYNKQRNNKNMMYYLIPKLNDTISK
jgi:hypothetical protein